MSDVTVAPSAPDTPQVDTTSEVAINENPTNSPTPVGQQAPDKPTDRPPTRREAIQAAFDRANKPQQAKAKVELKAPAKAAEAKPGHNQPPEEIEALDLKKRPSDQPRGERGQFKPRENREGQAGITGTPGHAQENAKGTNGTQPESSARTLPETAPYRAPPSRFSEGGKADWGSVPENVRGDVYRMHHDFEQAYQQYRGDSEAMQPIRHFHQMAQEHGTTLERALTNYVGMEQKLRQDVVGGLDTIVNNLNLRTPDGQRLGLRDVAYHILNQSPEQHQLVQSQNAQNASRHQIEAVYQQVEGLKNAVQQMHTAQQFTATRSAVDSFAENHPRFDELGDLIKNELDLGFDLNTAYQRAELLRPATHAAQTRTASAQTRPTDRSISGSPDASANGAAPRRGPPPSRREAIQSAIKRVNGGL